MQIRRRRPGARRTLGPRELDHLLRKEPASTADRMSRRWWGPWSRWSSPTMTLTTDSSSSMCCWQYSAGSAAMVGPTPSTSSPSRTHSEGILSAPKKRSVYRCPTSKKTRLVFGIVLNWLVSSLLFLFVLIASDVSLFCRVDFCVKQVAVMHQRRFSC